MPTTITGKVRPGATITGKKSVVVEYQGPTIPTGATVEVRVVLTDEGIGKRLRAILAPGGHGSRAEWDRTLKSLVEGVRDDVGWPVLAELIEEVAF